MERVTYVLLTLTEDTFLFTYPRQTAPQFDAIPILQNVSVTPAVIDPGQSIGQREEVSVSFADCLHRFDTDLFNAGTFWTKFRPRYPSIQGATLTVYRGENGEALEEMRADTYIVDSLQVSKDGASIKAKDPLYALNGSSAQTPIATAGELSSTLSVAGLSLTLSPAGIGNAQYASSGYLCVGGAEVVSFTRSGDVCTLSARGLFGTTAQEHSSETRVQTAVHYEDQVPSAIVSDLLERAGVDPTLWDDSEWTFVDDYVVSTFTAVITEPTAVKKLLDEICEQASLVIWYDPEAALIQLAPLAPVVSSEDITVDRIVADSFQITEQPDKRISQSETYFARRDVTRQLDDTRNYLRGALQLAANQGDYQQKSIKQTYSRWISQKTAAERLNALLIARYSTPPRKFAFTLFPTDTLPKLGDGVNISHWQLVDRDGIGLQVPAQIISVNTSDDAVRYEAEEMGFAVPITPEEGEVSLDNHTIIGGASAGFRFTSDGKLQALGGGLSSVVPSISINEWFTTGNVAGIGNDYYIRVTYSNLNGFFFGSATGVWLSLSTDQYWLNARLSGPLHTVWSVDISTEAGDAGIVASADITTRVE